jgi:hypothetical protein
MLFELCRSQLPARIRRGRRPLLQRSARRSWRTVVLSEASSSCALTLSSSSLLPQLPRVMRVEPGSPGRALRFQVATQADTLDQQRDTSRATTPATESSCSSGCLATYQSASAAGSPSAISSRCGVSTSAGRFRRHRLQITALLVASNRSRYPGLTTSGCWRSRTPTLVLSTRRRHSAAAATRRRVVQS